MFETIIGHGVKAADLDTLQVCVRAVIVFGFAVAMVRIASRRFLSDMTPLDVILGIMLGSILSRSINGPSPLLPTMTAAIVLVVLHRILNQMAYRFPSFAILVKGRSSVLVERGKAKPEAMAANHISHEDLLQGMRSEGGIADVAVAHRVTLERSGKISVVASG